MRPLPEEQPHNNPGFDVLSRDVDGKILRRIEIQSIGGARTGFGVWISATSSTRIAHTLMTSGST